jgi:hypothetical protein
VPESLTEEAARTDGKVRLFNVIANPLRIERWVTELEKFFDLTVNRELKMVELKKKLEKTEEKSKKTKKNGKKEL